MTSGVRSAGVAVAVDCAAAGTARAVIRAEHTVRVRSVMGLLEICRIIPATPYLGLAPSTLGRREPVEGRGQTHLRRGDLSRSSSMRCDACALVRFSSTASPDSLANVSRYERCAPVIGSSPVFQSSGFLMVSDASFWLDCLLVFM